MEGAARYTAGIPRAQVTQRLSAVQVITNGDVLVGLRRVALPNFGSAVSGRKIMISTGSEISKAGIHRLEW